MRGGGTEGGGGNRCRGDGDRSGRCSEYRCEITQFDVYGGAECRPAGYVLPGI